METSEPDEEFDPKDPEFYPHDQEPNYKIYFNFVQSAFKHGISNNVATELANSLLLDLNINDPSFYVSEFKMRQARKNLVKKLSEDHLLATRQVQCIGFDGKKSDVLQPRLQKDKMQEKIVMIDQASREYMTHFITKNGKGITIASHLKSELDKFDSSSSIKAASSDGCVTNTGFRNGAIRNLELLLNRPLQYFICLLHLAELVFCKLFMQVDGSLKGPSSYSGPIGSVICSGLSNGPMVQFNAIPGEVPQVDSEILQNDDTRKLYHLSHLVMNGPTNPTREQLSAFSSPPGKVTSSRWLSTANNILNLYCQTVNPSSELVLMCKIIVNIYSPAIFLVKKNWQFYQSSLHFFNILKFSKALLSFDYPDLYYDCVLKTLSNNAFSIHAENMVLCMLWDPNPAVNEEALSILEKLRHSEPTNEIRQFIPPKKINFDADHYTQLINFDDFNADNCTFPPLLSDLTLDDIRAKKIPPSFLKICCHSQHVERFIALSTIASQTVSSQEFRHSFIINKKVCKRKSTWSDCLEILKEK